MIEITTWSEFLSIADDGEYTLAKNITPDEGFDWTAYLPKSFSGIKIDGRGRAVGSKNNPIKAPLFENLTGAGIANLKVYADIDYTTLAGAVAVRAYAGEFANLTVNGKVASTASSGGLFGELNNNCEVRSCTNNAEVISVSNHSGGITAVSNNSKVYNCANTGAITGNDYAGGIASEAQTSAVLSCANSGTINVSVNGGYAGGIVAFIIGTDISDNINSGYVGSKQPLPGAAGGIVGYTTSLPCNITNNINTCRVKSTTMAGGIVGYGTANSNICTKNVNTGDVIGQTAGGLAGYLVTSEVGSVTDNRVCAKLIEADASNISRAGGLIGFSDPQDIPRSVERNYISIDKILGYDTTLAHYFIGSYDTPDPDAFPGNVYADNYYDANTNIEFSATPSDPSECDGATDPLILQLCGTLYTDAALPVGDKLAACMRGVWDETKHDCTFDEAEKLRRDAQDALISVIAGIASMENNLKDLLESAACILKRGIQSAEDVDDLTEINKVVMGLDRKSVV